jgi:cytochrome c oxidase cbb3-type subunit 4
MGIDTFRGVMTAILMVLFIALVFWAYSRRRHADFEAAARLPLDEYDESPLGRGAARDDEDCA